MARTDTLGHFLTDVADAIRTKTGSSESITASDFDTEIENIPSGGGTTAPTTIAEAQQQIMDVMTSFNESLANIGKTYTPYSQNAMTLYTPSANNKYYVIRYRDGQYQIVWFPAIYIFAISADTFMSYKITGQFNYSPTTTMEFCDAPYPEWTTNGANVTAYLSPYYSTIGEAIAAIQSPETTYTTGTNTSWGFAKESQNVYLPYTNLQYECLSGGQIVTNVEKKVLSHSETISVIQ